MPSEDDKLSGLSLRDRQGLELISEGISDPESIAEKLEIKVVSVISSAEGLAEKELVDVEKVRSEIFGLLGRESGSTYKNARRMFYETLFKNTAYARTINGSYRTVGSITPADLR